MKKYFFLILLLGIGFQLSSMELEIKQNERDESEKIILKCLNEKDVLAVDIEVPSDFPDWCLTIQYMLDDLKGQEVDTIPVRVPATSLTLLKEFHNMQGQESFLKERSIDQLVSLFKAMNFLDYKDPNIPLEDYKELKSTLDHLTDKISNKKHLKEILEVKTILGLAGTHEALMREYLLKKSKMLLADYSIVYGKSVSQRSITGYKANKAACVCLAPDDRTLFISVDNLGHDDHSASNIIQVWDMEKEDFLKPFTFERGPVKALSVSPDSKALLIGSKNCAGLWNIEKRECLFKLEHEGLITAACFNANGKRVLTGAMPNIKLWDARNGKHIKTIEINLVKLPRFYPEGSIQSLALSEDGTKVLGGCSMGGRLGFLNTWDLVADERRFTRVGPFPRVCIAHDNKNLINTDYLGGICVRDIKSLKSIKSFAAHDGVILSVRKQNKKKLLTASENSAKVWDIERELCLREIHLTNGIDNDYAYSVSFSTDGSKIITGSENNVVKILDLYDGELERSLKNLTSLRQLLLVYHALRYCEDGSRLLSSSIVKPIVDSLAPNLKELISQAKRRWNCFLT